MAASLANGILSSIPQEDLHSILVATLAKIPCLFFILSSTDYQIIFLNDRMTSLVKNLGLKEPADALNKTPWEVSSELKQLKPLLDHLKETAEILKTENLKLNIGGRTMYFDVIAIPNINSRTKEINSISVFCLDVTERKNTENNLKDSEQKYRTLMETSPDSITVTDLNGIITMSNAKMRGITGYSATELLGMNVIDLVAPEDKPRARETALLVSEEGQTVHTEHILVRKDGSHFHAETSISPLRNEEGAIIGAIIVARDITQRKQIEELNAVLSTITTALISTFNYDEIMRRVVAEASRLVGADAVGVCVREDYSWVVKYLHNLPESIWGLRISDKENPAFALVAASREPLAISDVSKETIITSAAKVFNAKSIMLVPLIIRNEVIGILFFIRQKEPIGFSDQEVNFARRLGDSVSLALANARLYEAQREAARREAEARLEAQQQLAQLQKALLPPKPTIGKGYNVAAKYIPALRAEIGGDFYDVFPTESGRIGILIGDVSGKGIEAAALAASTRSTARAFAYETSSAATTLGHTNSVLINQGYTSGSFVTLFLGILDLDTGKLGYSIARQPPPLVRRGTTGEVETLLLGQPPLCVLERLEFEEHSTRLNPNDKFILYTDGIIEARHDLSFFGAEELKKIIHKFGARSCQYLLDAILKAINNWTGGQLSDDIALIVIERTIG
ncbi:MAG: SpoIIE family protein phosphatase [Armatimonadetes bacterium]|nr:SpoIIE family protein phosphatase [Armatimonadota bacterium]